MKSNAESNACKWRRSNPATPRIFGPHRFVERHAASIDLCGCGHRPAAAGFQGTFHFDWRVGATGIADVNLAANRWLFQHLTETLDLRVLKLLTQADDRDLHSSFSVNLNVSTLLSREFTEFDTSLRTGGRGTIVLELQLIDIYSDVANYMFARDFVRERGYRICGDGVTHQSLPLIDRQALGADLIKLA